MIRDFDIAVVIPTYNRAGSLGEAIESVMRQSGDVCYELVVVDNNSRDDTRSVVERYIRNGGHIRYLFEEKQGTSNARNSGISNTTAGIIAFLDDDVRAESDWLVKIKRSFEKNPEISFIGGKVLPRWQRKPPAWLTPEHWSPLALIDYGDDPFVVDGGRQVCLVSANLAVRRNAFDDVGCFSPELRRCEDHELELRLMQTGHVGLYEPELVVTADVQIERLSKKYHRAWYMEHGRTLALMRAYHINEESDDGKISPALFDVPPYIYRQCLGNVVPWIKAIVKRDESKAFYYESQARDYFSYIREIQRRSRPERLHARLKEAAVFAATLTRRKLK